MRRLILVAMALIALASMAAGLGGLATLAKGPTVGASSVSPDGWELQEPPHSGNLHGIWGTSASNVFAVGDYQPFNHPFIHYDGDNWSVLHSWSHIDMVCWNDVWGSSSSDLYVVGSVDFRSSVSHYDGSSWTTSPLGGGDGDLYGIWGTSASDIFAVGGGSDFSNVMHYDGTSWEGTYLGIPTLVGPHDVWGSSSSNVFAVGLLTIDGHENIIIHYDGSSWSTMPSGTASMLAGVWVDASSSAFAVGEGGSIVHYNGTSWTTMASGTTKNLRAIWGSSSSDVFAVGDDGTIIHYDGSSWSTMASGTANDLTAVWGIGLDVFAVGEDCTILHYSKKVAPQVTTHVPTDVTFNAARLNGELTSLGTADDVTVSFEWGTTPGGPYPEETMPSEVATAPGTFYFDLGGLTSGTTYYFRAKAVGDTTALGSEKSLTTVAFAAPTVETNDANLVTAASATLNGNLASMGTATSVNLSFEWGLTTSYGSETAVEAKTEPGLFSTGITGLADNTTYHFRAKAVGDGVAYGGDGTFTTLASATAPSVTTSAATDLAAASATVNGSLSSLGSAEDVTVSFEWGLTTDYGNNTNPQVMNGPGSFSFALSGLAPDTIFHFRAKAVGDGTVYGDDMTFNTGTTPPAVTTSDATAVGDTSATLNGNLSAMGTASPVQVSFEYGESTSYGSTTPDQALAAEGTFSANLTGLMCGTVYHFRAKAVGDGTVYGEDRTLTTAACPTTPPTVLTRDASNITPTSATLNGELTSMGTAAGVTVSFGCGATSGGPYDMTADLERDSVGTFSVVMAGFTPGTTYYYRVSADGDGDTVYGVEKSFTTAQNNPLIENVDPDSGKRKQHLTVTISGANFDGATNVSFGSGITVEDFSVNSSTQITAEISIKADAAKGARDVTVTTAWGTATKAAGFTVKGDGGGICSGGALVTPGSSNEMTTVLAALGLLLGAGYLLTRRDARNSVRA